MTLPPLRAAGLLLPLFACAPTVPPPPVAGPPPTEAALIQDLRQVSVRAEGFPLTQGNAVTLLRDGPATYAAMIAAINGASRRIDMESYQFDTQAAPLFAALLARKAAQGVQVHLIYDAWGSMSEDTALFDQLRSGGVQVVAYNPIGDAGGLSLDLNQRDHRKILVVDDAVVITGGVNITGVYHNPKGSAPTDPERAAWRDTDVRITGPVVQQFEDLWAQTWIGQHGPALSPATAPASLPARAGGGDLMVQAIDGAPADGHLAIYDTLMAAFALAKRSIHLTTGFFVPTPDMDRALQDAARRGVDVRVIVPALSDSEAARLSGRAHYTDLLEAGVRIFERQGVVLHAKTAVIDGVWSTVGSSNLDWRSTTLNNEIDAVILGAGFGGQMEAMFRDDIAASAEITAAAWAQRGIGERMRELFARRVAPLL